MINSKTCLTTSLFFQEYHLVSSRKICGKIFIWHRLWNSSVNFLLLAGCFESKLYFYVTVFTNTWVINNWKF